MWETLVVRQGEEKRYLEEGWEPFAVSPHDESYNFYDSTSRKQVRESKTVDYIHLRRQSNKGYCSICSQLRELEPAVNKKLKMITLVCPDCIKLLGYK